MGRENSIPSTLCYLYSDTAPRTWGRERHPNLSTILRFRWVYFREIIDLVMHIFFCNFVVFLAWFRCVQSCVLSSKNNASRYTINNRLSNYAEAQLLLKGMYQKRGASHSFPEFQQYRPEVAEWVPSEMVISSVVSKALIATKERMGAKIRIDGWSSKIW